MKYARILILLVIWNLLPNCFPLPSSHRAEINELQSRVAVGVTSKEQIISILGKPDLERDRYILYLRREYDAGIYFMGFWSAGMTVGEEYMDLYFVFDDQGILTDYNFDKYDDGLRPIKDEGVPEKDKMTSKVE